MNTRPWTRSLLLAAGVMPVAAAQTHAVEKPQNVVRAVSVLEWTGDELKPTASRLVPVTLFIDGQLEDAGVYLSRPVPFVLQTGTIFELENAGVNKGTLEVESATRLGGTEVDGEDVDGWMGSGLVKPVAAAPVHALRSSATLPQVVTSGGNRPHFSNGGGKSSSSETGAQQPAQTTDRSGAAGSGTTVSAQGGDPDRPTMQRRTDDDTDADEPGKGVDRPTLKRRTPADTKAANKAKNQASVKGGGEALNDDPDRPRLHRGGDEQPATPPMLMGLPKGMRQSVAVSDARDRPAHDFARPWASETEHAQVLAAMQAFARTRLAAYGDAATPANPASIPAKKTATTATRRRTALAKPAATPPAELTDEQLKAYTLSYGGAATYVYTASSPGAGGSTRYVSVITQQEPGADLKLALATATDSAHLDRVPQLRPIDVVDAEASNRASLLVELRAQGTRQFALYRIIGAQAQQTFASGPTL